MNSEEKSTTPNNHPHNTTPPNPATSPLMHDHDAYRPPSPKYDEKAYGFFTLAPAHAYGTAQRTQHATIPRKRRLHTAAVKTSAEQQVDMHVPHASAHTPRNQLTPALHMHAIQQQTQAQAQQQKKRTFEKAKRGSHEAHKHGQHATEFAAATNIQGENPKNKKNGTDNGSESESGSDNDVPSPKYDETTCFFTRRSTKRHSKRRSKSKASLVAKKCPHRGIPAGENYVKAATGAQGAGTNHAPLGPQTIPLNFAGQMHEAIVPQNSAGAGGCPQGETTDTPSRGNACKGQLGADGVVPELMGSPAMHALQGAATRSHHPANTSSTMHARANAYMATGGHHTPAIALLMPQRAAFTNMRPQTTASRLSVPTIPAGGQGSELKPRFRTAVPGKGHELTTISVEMLAATRGQLLPDPRYDRVLAVVVAVWYDHEDVQVCRTYT